MLHTMKHWKEDAAVLALLYTCSTSYMYKIKREREREREREKERERERESGPGEGGGGAVIPGRRKKERKNWPHMQFLELVTKDF